MAQQNLPNMFNQNKNVNNPNMNSNAYSNDDFSGEAILRNNNANNVPNFGVVDDYDTKSTLQLNESTQALSHLTIKQILLAKASSDPSETNMVIIDNKAVGQVLIYGIVQKISHSQQTSHSVVVIHDLTGKIEIKFWNVQQNQKMKHKLQTLQTNTWIKVIGRINVFNRMRSISVFDIWPLIPNESNFMQLCHFYTEVIYAHQINTADEQILRSINAQNVQKYHEYQEKYRSTHMKSAVDSPNTRQVRQQMTDNYGNGRQGQYHNSNVNSNVNGNEYNYNYNNNRNQMQVQPTTYSYNYHQQQQKQQNVNVNQNVNEKQIEFIPWNIGMHQLNENNGPRLALQKRIYTLVGNNKSEVGCEKNVILNSFPRENVTDILNALHEMMESNAFYTPIDDHYKVVPMN